MQEGAVCAETIVVCGDKEIEWKQIFALAWLLLPRRTMAWPDWLMSDNAAMGWQDLEPNLITVLSIQRSRLRMEQDQNGLDFVSLTNLDTLLQQSSRLQATDPRDKVFAMRNLVNDLERDDWAPKPDYMITWQNLYTKMAVSMIERGSSKALRYAGILRHGEPDKNGGLPSWAPDWRAYPRVQYLKHDEWSAGSKRTFAFAIVSLTKKQRRVAEKLLAETRLSVTSRGKALRLTTVMQDTIAYLGGVVDDWDSDNADEPGCARVQELDKATVMYVSALEPKAYITSEDNVQAYNAALIASTKDDNTLATSVWVRDEAPEWHLWLQGKSDNSSPSFQEALDNMDTFVYKQFCITTGGYFCLVPYLTLPTDLIAIVKGYDMPVVLRPVGQYFVLLGDCYVHGMMEPQATNLMDEFSVQVKDGKVSWKPEGDVRANGLSLEVGEYRRILKTLGERHVELL